MLMTARSMFSLMRSAASTSISRPPSAVKAITSSSRVDRTPIFSNNDLFSCSSLRVSANSRASFTWPNILVTEPRWAALTLLPGYHDIRFFMFIVHGSRDADTSSLFFE